VRHACSPPCARCCARAIEAGGTTLKDFTANGAAGHYQEQAQVYGRAGEPCDACGRPVRRIVQGQRATYFCAGCQRALMGEPVTAYRVARLT
jgi:formamidopyrimidine-DNA glycosylase